MMVEGSFHPSVRLPFGAAASHPFHAGVGFHPPHLHHGGFHPLQYGTPEYFHSVPLHPPRTRAPIKPDAMLATDIVMSPPPHRPHGGSLWCSAPSSAPPPTVSVLPATSSVSGLLSEPSASVVSSDSHTIHAGAGVGGGGDGGSSDGSGAAGPLSSSSASSHVPPMSFTMSAEDEKDAAKALVKAMDVFMEGAKLRWSGRLFGHAFPPSCDSPTTLPKAP